MTVCTTHNKRFSNLLHFNRCLYTGRNTFLLQRTLYCQCIDYSCQHPHIVCLHTFDAHGFRHLAADEISPADNDCQIHTKLMHLFQFLCQ